MVISELKKKKKWEEVQARYRYRHLQGSNPWPGGEQPLALTNWAKAADALFWGTGKSRIRGGYNNYWDLATNSEQRFFVLQGVLFQNHGFSHKLQAAIAEGASFSWLWFVPLQLKFNVAWVLYVAQMQWQYNTPSGARSPQQQAYVTGALSTELEGVHFSISKIT